MSAYTDRWIAPCDHGWVVQKQDRTCVSSTFHLQVEAIMHAEEDIAHHGGGVLVILGRDGAVRQVTTVRAKRRTMQRT